MDNSSKIFGNIVPENIRKKASKSKRKFINKFGDDKDIKYNFNYKDNSVLGNIIGLKELYLDNKNKLKLPSDAVIIGNIRMGFGHYRIAIAMASCAKAMGYTPFWLDLSSLENTTCSKIIKHQNELYSKGSRISQKSALFNKVYWEPLNYNGFKKLSYNAVDQKISELMATPLLSLPKDIPFIATHVWVAQAAVQAGLKNVINAIPDNWPMALHLAEGSIHTVQTPSSYFGYKVLREMDKKIDFTIPTDKIFDTGHYVDDEFVTNIEKDSQQRISRIENKKAKRYLLSIGGAGAGYETLKEIIKNLIPYIEKKEATLFINVGDHIDVFNKLKIDFIELENANLYNDDFEKTKKFVSKYYENNCFGINVFYHRNLFSAVYTTNLLMRISDVLITKPSELSFYPIPKLMIKHVGGHEKWGAIRSAEMGDGTFECESNEQIIRMLKVFQEDNDIIRQMCKYILQNKNSGVYNGGYNVVKLATNKEHKK